MGRKRKRKKINNHHQSNQDESLKVRSFPDLESKIKEIIEDLEGSVFPKLNWSAPKVNILNYRSLNE
jgi:hypothetical protein